MSVGRVESHNVNKPLPAGPVPQADCLLFIVSVQAQFPRLTALCVVVCAGPVPQAQAAAQLRLPQSSVSFTLRTVLNR